MTHAIQVVTTLPSREQADALAAQLVERRLAACVQCLGPITSTYRWQGAVEKGEEWLCVIKSLADAWPRLEQAIRELHPYEVPEILRMDVVAGNHDYLAWLRDAVAAPEPPRVV